MFSIYNSIKNHLSLIIILYFNLVLTYDVGKRKIIFNQNYIIFYSTIVCSSWQYKNFDETLNFDKAWNNVKEIILQNFAGDIESGIKSPSVQNTIYLAQKEILNKIKEVSDNLQNI